MELQADCSSDLRFGIEIELNSFDSLDRPAYNQVLPKGAEHIAKLVNRSTEENTFLCKWDYYHNNSNWIIKMDGSCGLEICSPLLRGYSGVETCCDLIYNLSKDGQVKADSRCSLHVHVDFNGHANEQIGSVLAQWIKCEPIFLDSVPSHRKRNRYCQFIGLSDLFEHDEAITSNRLITRLGCTKYPTINTFHLAKGKRRSVEFRIAGNDACLDPFYAKNWIRLILHFCEQTKNLPLPQSYVAGDVHSGLCWYDPKDVFNLLGFSSDNHISEGLQQVRNWFLANLVRWQNSDLEGIWGPSARFYALKEVQEIIDELALNEIIINDECIHPSNMSNALYGENFIL